MRIEHGFDLFGVERAVGVEALEDDLACLAEVISKAADSCVLVDCAVEPKGSDGLRAERVGIQRRQSSGWCCCRWFDFR